MAAYTEPIEILLHLPLLAEDKVSLMLQQVRANHAAVNLYLRVWLASQQPTEHMRAAECTLCICKVQGRARACLWRLSCGEWCNHASVCFHFC